MDYEKRIFWKYLWNEEISLKSISSYKFYQTLVMIIATFIIFFTPLTLRIKGYIFIVAWAIVILIYVWHIYKSGIHLGWWREKTGIPTKSYIKKIKEKYREKQKIEEPKVEELEEIEEIKNENSLEKLQPFPIKLEELNRKS